ncbi:MAG TPA: chemotaxis response regulator protein-glutamate methylesterase [Methylophilaceae bacterium]
MSEKIKVVVVDDSLLIRNILVEIINSETDMEVVATAPDPLAARELIRTHNPDVITLDIEMPKMNGLDFLEKLMRLRPTPVIMISTLTERGAEITLRALELGAVDFIPKPKNNVKEGLQEYARDITEKIRAAAHAHCKTRAPALVKNTVLPLLNNASLSREMLLIIGASTGGTEAIKNVLIHLPPDSPGILITQHMPEGFTKSFAARLDSLCAVRVKEAEHGDKVMPGHAYLAPGHSHLLLNRRAGHYFCELSQSEPVNRHRPSVDVLFDSAAVHAGKKALGVILTGMGRDGASGMLAMRNAGAHTFAQDEESCVVFGMPKEAIARGGVDDVLPLSSISGSLMHYLKNPMRRHGHKMTGT